MAVLIPKLQPIQQSNTLPQNERINIQAPDLTSTITSRTNAAAGLAKEGVDLYYDIEDSKISQLSTEAEQEFKTWNQSKLEKLKDYKGDPTDAYAQYDIDAKAKYDEILNKRPDLNDRMKRHITANLSKSFNDENLHVLKQRGAQIETYKNNLYESQLKLKKNDLGTNIGYVNSTDPGSFLPMDQNISDIKTTVAKNGFDNGLAKKLPNDAKSWNHIYRDEEGNLVKVQFTDMAKQKIAKNLSEGVKESLQAMLATATTDEARSNYQAAYDRYKPYLDAQGVTTLNKSHKDNLVNDSAAKEVARVELLPVDQQITELEKIKDPLIKEKAFQKKAALDSRRKYLRDQQDQTNHDLVAKEVLSKQMYGKDDLENNRIFKAVKSKLSAKSLESLYDAVDAPKRTDPKAEARMQNLIFGNDPDNKLEGMSPEKFMEYKRGLSKADQNKYENIYTRLNTQSGAEERSTHKRAEQFLRDQLLSDKYIKRQEYGNALTPQSQNKYTEARTELLNYLSTAPKNMNDTQLLNYVREYSAKKIKGELFAPKQKPVFNEPVKTTNNITELTTPAKSDVERLRGALDAWKKNHQGENPVKGSPDWINFLKNYKG